jgi:cytochrome c biogenesis protein CcmG, thiol:disulfide interchange protein DsbE
MAEQTQVISDQGIGQMIDQAPDEGTMSYPSTAEAIPPRSRSTAIWRILIVGVLLVFVWFLAVGLQRQNVSERRASGAAPEFEFVTFNGETVRLADLRGQGVVVNFWASWCEPCRAEAALLEAAWRREQANGIVFIGLDYLDQEHSALAYIDEFGISYPNGVDLQSAAARRYGIQGVPETFFIDPEGEITSMVIGPLTTEADLNRRLDAIRPQ